MWYKIPDFRRTGGAFCVFSPFFDRRFPQGGYMLPLREPPGSFGGGAGRRMCGKVIM